MAFKKLKLYFDRPLAQMLAEKLIDANPEFKKDNFIEDITKGVQTLELKPRVELIADKLRQYLGDDYPKNIATLLKILGPENEEETGMFINYYWIMPIAKYVEKYGLEHFDVSMNAISEITKRNTGEYAIRPFIRLYPDKTLAVLLEWSKTENKHIRRLASEGPRPRLPWATKLQLFIDSPSPLLPILDSLKDDSSKYVQKSVANCINDIYKDNPQVAFDLLNKWETNATPQRKWIIKHASRNF